MPWSMPSLPPVRRSRRSTASMPGSAGSRAARNIVCCEDGRSALRLRRAGDPRHAFLRAAGDPCLRLRACLEGLWRLDRGRSPMMQASTTVFTVKDIAASRDYFRDRLGFKIAFEWGQPTFYVGLFADNIRLHLIEASHAPRPAGHGAMVIDVDDVDGLHADLSGRGAKVVKPPKDQPYGM